MFRHEQFGGGQGAIMSVGRQGYWLPIISASHQGYWCHVLQNLQQHSTVSSSTKGDTTAESQEFTRILHVDAHGSGWVSPHVLH
jgi:hypothetical protein